MLKVGALIDYDEIEPVEGAHTPGTVVLDACFCEQDLAASRDDPAVPRVRAGPFRSPYPWPVTPR